MKKIKLFFAISILSILTVYSQIKMDSNGNIGIGSETTPTSKVELGYQEFIRFNALQSGAGILFYESNGSSATNVQYGARIFYDGGADGLRIVTKQDYVDNLGIFVNRTYGRVGIRKDNPSEALDIYGNTKTSGVFIPSDISFKKNIESITKDKIDNLYLLNCKTFNLDYQKLNEINFLQEQVSDSSLVSGDNITNSENITQNKDNTDNIIQNFDFDEDKTHIGFIAQEVKALYPELIAEDNQGYLSIDYISLIPILVEALKEQQTKIEELGSLINNSKLKSTRDITLNNSNTAELFQNQPNPFSEDTEIKYFLPESDGSATIYIYDMQGKQIKCLPLHNQGESKIIIHGSELQPGMYLYTLILDNKEIDTKHMILTE